MTTTVYILLALLMLGVMITVHELGHFTAARLCGIAVKQFGIGFGPKLAQWKSKKHETLFSLRLIPVGGFCMFYGEDDTQEKEKDDPRNFNNVAAWKRLVTILSGPVMNFVLAFVVACCFCALAGIQTGTGEYLTTITEVNAGSPAEEAGLLAGDQLLAVDGVALKDDLREHLSAYAPGGEPLALTVLRGDEELILSARPRYDEAEKANLLGVLVTVSQFVEYRKGTVGQIIAESARWCVSVGGAILSGFKTMLTTGRGLEDTAGIVGILQIIVQETAAYQWRGYLNIMLMISVNLGLFNLFPIPGLDGSRAVLLLVEMVRRKPINRKIEAYIHMSGFVLLAGLMLLLVFRDIARLL